mmetsp:Transcript_12387/g.15948  ORF Transcript_12387/g.15948 Transcript_12387/m.15948 type:complete len:279 (-) Transcript_12387:143-979(-)
MGLIGDRNVPNETKWAYFSSHYSNLRYNFQPNHGYNILKNLIGNRDHFILTSNVDGCFERAGFNKDNIYTPQGDAAYIQCLSCCQPNSVFESKPIFNQLLPTLNQQTGCINKELIPICPNCNGPTFMNLRGGSFFLHTKYNDANDKFRSWIDKILLDNKKLIVIEIGAGFNTPTITRFPVEIIIRESQINNSNSCFIRINPEHADIPMDIKRSIEFKESWQILENIEKEINSNKNDNENEIWLNEEMNYLNELSQSQRAHSHEPIRAFDWRKLLSNLK